MERQKMCQHIIKHRQTSRSKYSSMKRKRWKNNCCCSEAVKDYNKNIGYIDYFDQMKSTYEINRKSKKWWHRIFFHFLDVTLINSFLLYCMHPDSDPKLKKLKSFRMDIIRQLIPMGNKDIAEKRKTPKSPIQVKKHRLVSDEKRYRNAEYLPVRVTSRQCAVCSTTEKPRHTKWMCKKCNVGLCMHQKDVHCFQKINCQ